MFEMIVSARHANRAVLIEAICSDGRSAEKRSGLIVELAVRWVRTGCPVSPAARLIWREAKPPGFSAVPEPVNQIRLTRW